MPDTGSEERFKALFEAAGDAIFLMDGDTFIACNQKTLEMFRCPQERIIGNHPYVLSPATQPDGRPSADAARERITAALNGELQRFPWRHIRCDGTEFDAEVTLTRVQLNGKWHLQAIVRDKTREIGLQREQERLVAIIEHTPEYIGTATPDGKVIYLNDAFKRIVPERFRDQAAQPGVVPLVEFHPPETGKMLTETAIPYAVKHGMWQGESALLDARGKPFAVLQTIVAHLGPTGRLEFISTICRDIEAYKAAQQEMETSERRFRGLIENSAEGIMLLNAAGDITYESISSSRICGRRPEDRIGTPAGQYIHPDDRAAFDRWFTDILAAPGKPLLTTVRNQRADGVWTTLEVVGTNQLENPAIGGVVVNLRDITERAASEQRFRALVENSSDVVMILAQDGKRLYVSPNITRFNGRTVEEVMRTPDITEHIHPDDKQLVRTLLADVGTKPDAVQRGQFRVRHKDGHWLWFEAVAQNRLAVPGINGIVVNLRDVSVTHEAEQKVRQTLDLLVRAERIARMGTYSYDVATGTWTSTAQLDEIFGITADYPHTVDGWTGIIHPDEREAMRQYFSRDVLGNRQRFDREYRILRPGDKRVRWVHGYGDLEYGTDGAPVRMVGIIIDITEAHAADEKLRTAEERFRLAAEQTGQLIYDWNIRDSVQVWDGDTVRVIGYTLEECRNISNAEWAQMIHPDDREKATKLLDAAVAAGAPYHAEYRYRRKDGSYILMEDTGAFLRDEQGRVYRMIGAMKDISGQREARDIERQAEERFRLAAEQTGQLIYDWDIAANATTKWEGAIEQLTGYTPDEYRRLSNDDWYKLIHPDDLAATTKLLEDAQRTGRRYRHEYRLRRKDGSYALVEDVGGFLLGPSGAAVRMIGAIKDVSEVREAARLREQQAAMFREVIDNSLDAITIVTPDGSYRYQNRAALEISGYSAGDPADSNAFQNIHPDDLPAVRKAFDEGLQTGKPARAVFRYRKKDGSWQWLEVAGISMLTNPLVQGVILFSQDITEQRMAQARTQEARDRLDSIINAIGDPVFVKDAQHRWVLVNDAFCRLTGKQRTELLGKSDYDFFPAPQADAAWAKDSEVLASGTEVATEEVFTDAQGAPQYLFTKKTMYTDPSGVKFIVGVMRDISVLRKARETEARAQELERLNKVMVGRELRMIELKRENDQLHAQLEKQKGGA